ncbi:MAG: hypothetical protein LH480_03090 [Rubrivivax sp.]|nr:hypothetical protein [Rubrivivax sp.]
MAQSGQLKQLKQLQREAGRSVLQQAGTVKNRWQDPIDVEAACFVVHQVWIEADEAGAADQINPIAGPVQQLGRYEGACLGVGSIEALRSNLQARLHERGYITSGLVVPPQDLRSGTLGLRLVAGRIESVLVDAGAGTSGFARPAKNAFSMQAGDVLNLRDVEQTLENLSRLPSQASRFGVQPGTAEQASVVRIVPADGIQRGPAVIGLDSLDGPDYGPLQASVQAVVDAPLGLSDQLSMSLATARRQEAGGDPVQSSAFLFWGVSAGAHLLNLSISRADHSRYFAGGVGRFAERGTDQQVRKRWQWTAWRSEVGRLQAWFAWSDRRARTRIGDIELIARRRIGSSTELGLTWWQRHACGVLELEAEGAQVQRLERDLDFQPALDGLPRQWRLGAQVSCRLSESGWDLMSNAWLQRVARPVDGSDLLVLGSRCTVRGYRPGDSLIGQGMGVMRHELLLPAWPLAANAALRGALALEWGRVLSPVAPAASGGLAKRELAAAAATLRWQAAAASGEPTVALPLTAAASSSNRGARWSASARVAF